MKMPQGEHHSGSKAATIPPQVFLLPDEQRCAMAECGATTPQRCDLFYRGSFDPPTLGHLGLLLAAKARFSPEKIIVVINDYTRKSKRYRAPAEARKEMFQAMLSGSGLDVDVDVEFHFATDRSPICYSDIRKQAEYAGTNSNPNVNPNGNCNGVVQIGEGCGEGKKLLVMVTGIDTLSQWRDACADKDKIALAWREFELPATGPDDAAQPATLDGFVRSLNDRFPMRYKGFGETVEVVKTEKGLEKASSTMARKLLKEGASTVGVLEEHVAEIARDRGYYA